MSKEVKRAPARRIWRGRPLWLVRLGGRLPMPRRVQRKRVFVLLISVLLLLAVLNFGVAWCYSGVLSDLALEVREDEPEYNLIGTL